MIPKYALLKSALSLMVCVGTTACSANHESEEYDSGTIASDTDTDADTDTDTDADTDTDTDSDTDTDTDTDTNSPTSDLADPLATAETVTLWRYLKSIEGENALAGIW